MKTTSKNRYALVNQILIPVVGAVFGYNVYQIIAHPESANIGISLILVVVTSIMVRKYGYKTVKEKK